MYAVDAVTEPKTLLLVDDMPDNIALLSLLIKGRHRIRAATHGARALEIAASEPQPDLILLDIMMPEMDGYEVCRRLKADPHTAAIPVIFLTANIDARDEERGFLLGAVDYITKPISPAVARARIETHLALHNARQFLQDHNAFLEAKCAAVPVMSWRFAMSPFWCWPRWRKPVTMKPVATSAAPSTTS